MATWVTHLIIADRVLKEFPELCRHEFCVGNIAPDCNVENEDWTSFTPSREVTHWMNSERKVANDCERFLHEYIEKKDISNVQEESFLLGYYAHLITDAEFQRFIRDEERVKASWDRIKHHHKLREKAVGMEENWDSIKILIGKKDRMKDIYSIERAYLDENPNSGYLEEIIGLESFPDYIDYLPQGAIVRKVEVMGYMPERTDSNYPYVGMSIEEYQSFLDRAVELVVEAIRLYREHIIKKATKRDAKEIAKLAIRMWSSHTIDELTEEFETMIESLNNAIFVLCVNEQMVGFAQCQLRHDYVEGTDSSPVGYLEGVFVEEAYRRQGCAKKLLAKCEKWAKENGCSEFASDCELENTKSFEFHMPMGFEEANRIICFKKQL